MMRTAAELRRAEPIRAGAAMAPARTWRRVMVMAFLPRSLPHTPVWRRLRASKRGPLIPHVYRQCEAFRRGLCTAMSLRRRGREFRDKTSRARRADARKNFARLHCIDECRDHAPLTIRRDRRDPGGAAAEDADEDVGRDHHGRAKSPRADRSSGRHRRLGRSGLGADHDRRHPGRARRRGARSSRADADRQERPRMAGAAPGLHRALLGNGGAHSAVEMAVLDLIGRATGTAADRSGRPPAPQRREADVAPRQQDRRRGRRRGARPPARRASISSSSRSA